MEPTCDYCGASDKLRCRTKKAADACIGTPKKIRDKLDNGSFSAVSLSKKTEEAEITVLFSPESVDEISIFVSLKSDNSSYEAPIPKDDISTLIDMLHQIKKY